MSTKRGFFNSVPIAFQPTIFKTPNATKRSIGVSSGVEKTVVRIVSNSD